MEHAERLGSQLLGQFQIPKPFSVVELEADEVENYVALEDMAKNRNVSVESLSASMLGN